ncbi:MAG: nitrite reductase small subunit NirD [Candidatus Competibacteraceae bacterium]|nr:nitrite reductase small subunit NirD [Candidatus Competibacteraceae bacterium]
MAETNDWQEIGTLEDIPRLGARVIHTRHGDIAVFRTALDQVFALRDRCPHRGGPLSQGIVHGRRVTCPLHNLVLELDSGEAVAPDTGCTRSFPVRLEGERVLLQVGNVVEMSASRADCA